MRHTQAEHPMQSLLRAVFETRAAFFELPRITTFGDLVDRLCHLGEPNESPSTGVDVAAAPAGNVPSIRAAMPHVIGAGDHDILEVKPRLQTTP